MHPYLGPCLPYLGPRYGPRYGCIRVRHVRKLAQRPVAIRTGADCAEMGLEMVAFVEWHSKRAGPPYAASVPGIA
eukprot:1613587-Rhodomonas_salina.3